VSSVVRIVKGKQKEAVTNELTVVVQQTTLEKNVKSWITAFRERRQTEAARAQSMLLMGLGGPSQKT